MIFGSFRHKVDIQYVSEVDDGYGGLTSTWATSYSRRAKIKPKTSDETYLNDQDYAKVRGEIMIRYDSSTKNLTPKNRLLFGTRVLNIKGVLNHNEKNRYLIVEYEEDV